MLRLSAALGFLFLPSPSKYRPQGPLLVASSNSSRQSSSSITPVRLYLSASFSSSSYCSSASIRISGSSPILLQSANASCFESYLSADSRVNCQPHLGNNRYFLIKIKSISRPATWIQKTQNNRCNSLLLKDFFCKYTLTFSEYWPMTS